MPFSITNKLLQRKIRWTHCSVPVVTAEHVSQVNSVDSSTSFLVDLTLGTDPKVNVVEKARQILSLTGLLKYSIFQKQSAVILFS